MKNHKFATLLRRSYRVLNLVMVLAMMLAPTMRVSASTWTDKPDYQPGELVTISGQDSEIAAYDEALPVQVNVTGPNGWTGYCEGTWTEGVWSCQVELSPDPSIALGDYTYDVYQGEIYIESGGFTDGSIGLYDQCSNDDGDGYAGGGDTGCRWINGNLNRNNSTYYEGDSTVQRAWLTAYIPGSEHTVTFKYGTTKGANHAYDFLTTWDYSENWITLADRCQDITGCTTADEMAYAIPQDPLAMNLDNFARNFAIRGGTITAVSVPEKISGEYGIGDTETSITVDFTVANDGPMCATKQGATTCGVAIWFGAHIALTSEWLGLDGFTGAAGIPGSPYHVALDAIDGLAIGQRDNQMQSNAVVVIHKTGYKWHDENGNGVWEGTELPLSGWVIYVDYDDDGEKDPTEPWATTMVDDPLTIGVDETGYYDIVGINEGTWKVRELLTPGWTCSYPTTTDAFGCYYEENFTRTGTYENNNFGNYMWTPAINIEKTGDTLSKVGDSVNYTITVTNNSGVGTPDLSCTITDAMLGIDKDVTLATGASDVTSASYVVQVGDSDPLLNTASVDCTYVGGSDTVATDSDGHSVNLFQPSVNVEKTGSPVSKLGDPANYTITVTNTSSGDSPGLVNGTIVDTLLGNLLDAANPFVTSNTCTTSLATGGSCVIEATRIVLGTDPDPLPNTVTVHYNPSGFPNDITDSDDHSVDLFQPAINLLKTGDELSKIGDPVDYVITLENNSSIDTPDLTCTVTDALVGVNATFSVAAGADHIINVNDFIIPANAVDPFVNTANVVCSPEGFTNVYRDTASWETDLFQPAINLLKTGDELSKIGDPVDYVITLENNSSIDTPDLTCTVTDALVGVNATFSVAAGADHIINVNDFIIPANAVDPFVNTANVVCSPEGFTNVYRDTASWETDLFQPAINLLKTGDELSKIGDPVDYVITLENNSSIDTPDLTCTVTDALVGVNATFSVAAGADHIINVNDFIIPANAVDPFVNTANVVCSPEGFTNVYRDTASWETDLFQPAINLLKTGDELSKIGDPVDYVITLENNSSIDTPDLTCTVTDALVGVNATFSVAAGADHIINVNDFIIPANAVDPFVNTANVVCSPEGFTNVYRDTASWETDLFQPAINLLKTGDELSKIGDPVDYVITLENNSSIDTPDLTCTVTDALVGVNATFSVAAGADHIINVNDFIIPANAVDPFVNTANVVCSPEGFTNVYRDTASWETDLFQPAINLLKTGDELSKIGDPVDYVITLENNSSIDTPDLTCTVTDALVGVNATFSVAAGADHIINVNDFIIPANAVDPFVNTANVVCSPEGFTNVYRDTASWETDLFQPAINLLKTGDELSKIGDPVDYVITLENNSSIDTPDLTCTVTDALVGVNATFSVAAGADHIINVNDFIIPANAVDPFVNTANVVCSPEGFTNVYRDTASWETDLFQPAINLLKTGDELSKIGDPVDYVITLENNSSIDTPDLTCTVTDALVGVNATFSVAAGADHIINVNDFIIPANAVDPFVNTANVVCSPEGFTNVYRDTASWETNLFQPSVSLTKVGPDYSKVGDIVTYTVTITNTSSADTPNLVLADFTDNLVSSMDELDLPAGCQTLAPAASCTFTYDHLVVTGDDTGLPGAHLDNTASVLYHPTGFPNDIEAEDSWVVTLIHPSFTLTKEGDAFSKYDTLAEVPFGDVIDYELTLVNTGDVDLVLGDLNDSLEPLAALSAECATLVVGETCTFNYSHTVTATEGLGLTLVNTATVLYTLPAMYALSNVITRSDNWTTTLLHPGFTLDKACMAEPVLVGADAMFEITFCNTGDADLVFTLDEDVYEGAILRVAGYEFTIAVGDPCLVLTVTVTDPIPSGMRFENDVTASIGLADRYGLDNTWSAYSSDACTVWFWGFTPGFWKNHTADSPSGHDAWQYTAYLPTDDLPFNLGTFGGLTIKGSNKTYGELKMWDALSLKGGTNSKGALEILLRAGTAAVLNASFHETVDNEDHPAPDLGTPGDIFSITIGGTAYNCTPLENPDGGVYFPCTSADIIAIVNAAIATHERDVMISLAGILDSWNNGWHMIDWSWPVP